MKIITGKADVFFNQLIYDHINNFSIDELSIYDSIDFIILYFIRASTQDIIRIATSKDFQES